MNCKALLVTLPTVSAGGAIAGRTRLFSSALTDSLTCSTGKGAGGWTGCHCHRKSPTVPAHWFVPAENILQLDLPNANSQSSPGFLEPRQFAENPCLGRGAGRITNAPILGIASL